MPAARPVVVVHAPYHRPAHYEQLIRRLRTRTDVRAPDVGHLALVAATRTVQTVVDELPTAPVVVSHSFSGAIAGALHGVAHHVFVSAFVLEADETATTTLRPALVADPVGGGRFMTALRPLDDGRRVAIDPALAGELFYNGCSPDDTAHAITLLRPALADDFTTRPVAATWHHTPTRFVHTLQDRTWPAGLQETFAGRCEERATIDSGHSPFLSHPGRLARIVAEVL